MKAYILSALLFTTIVFSAGAQSLQTTVQKIAAIKNTSFTEVVKFKISFQDDFSVDTLKTYITVVPAEKQIGGYYHIQGKKDAFLYDGAKAVWLNLRDTTYKITAKAIGTQYTRTLLHWKKEIERYLQSPSKIKQQADTVIGKVAYTHYLVMQKDTIEKSKRVYTAIDLVINKATGLPFIVKSEWNGFADDGAYMGMFEQHTFTNYRFNQKNFPDLSAAIVPPGFKLPVKNQYVPMLAAGTAAPALKLTTLTGNDFDLASLRGKAVLLNFTTDGCPHCVNAAQMLTRLYDQHKSKGLEIVSIYQQDFNSPEKVAKFDAKHSIKYPSYMAEKTAAGTYHINGYPNFYLLDKQGSIVQAYEGFYAELEKQITDKLATINE